MGDRIAIVDGNFRLTYAQLRRRSSAISQALRARGILPGDRIALLLDNSWQYVVSYLGVLAAGGVVVPLGFAARERDLLTWVRHVDASLLIADPEHGAFAAMVSAMPGRCADISDFASLEGSLDSSERFAASPDSPATVVFTSGTTGAAKGILLSHGNLRANAFGIVESLALTADDSVMAVLPFTHAYGSSVLFSHLACGARVVIQRGFVFPEAVVESMARERVTGLSGVPSTFALLLSRVQLDRHDLAALRYLTQAGGPMTTAMTRRLVESLPGKRIFVMYGQTEATSRLTCLPAERLMDKLGSVGLPLRHVELEIRAADGRELPAGEPGEIWTRGPHVMAGYWRNSESTDQVLREGWLRTGDLGYRDADGFLYIVGRRSDMIKVGAYRVAPQDVEEVLAELPDVSECAVVGVDDQMLGEVIKAFIVRPRNSALQEMHVKRHCRERLAAYKVPKFVEFVADLPRTSLGKLQRSKLHQAMEAQE